MEKEFVSYQLAIKLEELGFDESCCGFYDHMIKEIDTISADACERLCKHHTHIKAPTYSQAFRWFRERYELGHMINGIGYESFIFNIGGLVYSFGPFQFKNYEEAEAACLTKLIEIVEQKKK